MKSKMLYLVSGNKIIKVPTKNGRLITNKAKVVIKGDR